MTGFSDAELDYMAASSGDRQEGRLKITGREGNFRIVPVRVAYDPGDGTIEIVVDGTGKDGTPACATVRPTARRLAR